MSTDSVLVTVSGLIAAAGLARFCWFKRSDGVQAATVAEGYQEQMLLVKGGYTPHTVRMGMPRRRIVVEEA